MTPSEETDAQPKSRPWQVLLCVGLFAFIALGVGAIEFKTITGTICHALRVMIYVPISWNNVKASVLLIPLGFIVCVEFLWLFGIFGLYRGKFYGIITAFATLTICGYNVFVGAFLAYARNIIDFQNHGLGFMLRMGFILLGLLGLAALLLTRSAMKYCDCLDTPKTKIVIPGIAVGTVGLGIWIGSVYLVSLSGPWFKH